MRSVYLLFGSLCSFILLITCQSGEQTNPVKTGAQLAQTYCGACHQYPAPDLLDRRTWEQAVLPRMGYLMGIYSDTLKRSDLLEPGEGGARVQTATIFPEKPTISAEDWAAIQAFYLEAAPDQLTLSTPPAIQMELPGFEVRWPAYQLSPPSVTLAKITETGCYIGDANTQSLLAFDDQLQLRQAAKVKEGAVHLEENKEALLLTLMGSFSPTDAALGSILLLPTSTRQSPVTLLDQLQRPVHTSYGDLNQDGRMDILVCEFGKWTGSLSWYAATPGQAPKKQVLRAAPGATKAYIQDLNRDGLPDIVALFGQGDEGIFAYYNQGQGNFSEERLLQFPSSYGSSFFKLQDLNADGHLDIIYTAGDNADYSPILKPYHGIYFFTNDGQNQFEQSFFYPLHGAYGAVVQDFDQDGDVDIAALSFFPDFASGAKEGFVYLQNQGGDQFVAHTFPEVADGRWIVMDAGDMDADGDLDLLLGSLAFEVVNDSLGYLGRWLEKSKGFVVLENKLR